MPQRMWTTTVTISFDPGEAFMDRALTKDAFFEYVRESLEKEFERRYGKTHYIPYDIISMFTFQASDTPPEIQNFGAIVIWGDFDSGTPPSEKERISKS